jgi:hypothetical protein
MLGCGSHSFCEVDLVYEKFSKRQTETVLTLPGAGGAVSFKYDLFGRRIYKSSSGGTSVYSFSSVQGSSQLVSRAFANQQRASRLDSYKEYLRKRISGRGLLPRYPAINEFRGARSLRIPGEADHHSGVIPITIPG